MNLEAVRISVGRTWRFSVDGQVGVAEDLSGYRQLLDRLKAGGPETDSVTLPWPRYRSKFWTHMFSGTYQNTRTSTLVALLLPLRQEGSRSSVPGCRGSSRVEVFEHPFAVTTLLHLEVDPVDPWPAPAEAALLLNRIMTSAFEGGEIRDGIPLESLYLPPTHDTRGRPIVVEEARRFIAVSALHDEPDGRVPATALASQFEDLRPDAAASLRSNRGAVRVDGDAVGLTLPRDLPRAGQKLGCLHHNVTSLLSYLQNLLTLIPASSPQAGDWYQRRAALLMNHMYRRAPLPETGTIYRSRLPQLWVDEHHLAPYINALSAGDLPALPTGN